MIIVAVEEHVTVNGYGGDARNRKQLMWRIIGPWRFSEWSPPSSAK